jgi:ATPase subunit of ABC transporter with duplicated ATPase domains
MMTRNVLMKMICALHEQREERKRRYQREERRRKAAIAREKGWKDLFDHMSKRAARASGLASQPVSLTAQEAAGEVKRDEAHAHTHQGPAESSNTLPLARS